MTNYRVIISHIADIPNTAIPTKQQLKLRNPTFAYSVHSLLIIH